MKTVEQILSSFPTIEVNKDIILRQFDISDALNYFKFYNIEEVNRFIPDSMIPATLDGAKLEITSIIQAFQTKQTIYWAIADRKTNILIGGCGFHDWNRYNARIEIAYDLFPKYWRKGIMFSCVKEVIKYAFMEMGIVRVQATTVRENDASNNLLLKFGFRYEGLLRRYKFFKNKMVDVMMFSYTIDDFNRDVKLGKYLK